MLRSAVTLERKTQAPSGATGMTVEFVPVDTTWASVRGVKELAFAETVAAGDGASHVIRIRWRSREGFDHIGGDAGRRWRVLGIRDPDDRRRYLDIFAAELKPEVED